MTPAPPGRPVPARRNLFGAAAAAAIGTAAAFPWGARAQPAAWPTRTLRILIPFAPGGPVEVPTRVIADHLTQRLGQTVIIETRPGAGGAIGAQAVVQANDPHLLLATRATTRSPTSRRSPSTPTCR